jgi:hypothetical protein
MTADQWIGVWLLVAAAVQATAATVLVVGGLAVLRQRKDGGRGGCRGPGCRREAGRHGCTTTPAAEGPAAGDLTTLARAGWVEIRDSRTRR